MNGIINLLKPPGMTSHDLVGFIRKKLNTKKVGHTGTLDPEAAGVLPICVGKATKAVQYLIEDKKRYRANIRFGEKTDTQDKYGNIIKKVQSIKIDNDELKQMLLNFTGRIQQTPPMYSAVKVKGKKLYEYARNNQSVDVKSRKIEVFNIEIIRRISEEEFLIDILCSKGTYIRTLCNDIGEISGYGAHMTQLIRLEAGDFNISNSFSIEEINVLCNENKHEKFLNEIDSIFLHLNRVNIRNTARKSALNGNHIFKSGVFEDIEMYETGDIIRLYLEDNFIGLGQIDFDNKNKRNYIRFKTLFI